MFKVLVIALLNLILCSNSKALVTYYFNGVLEESFGTLNVGDSFSGSFSYEYPQSPSGLTISGGGVTTTPYSLTSFNINIGNENVSFGPSSSGTITIRNDTGGALSAFDGFQVSNLNQTLLAGQSNVSIRIVLSDYSKNVFSDTNLPDDFLRLDMFKTYTTFFGPGPNPAYLSLNDSRSSLTSLIPEPSALSLLAVGLGVVLRQRRRTV